MIRLSAPGDTLPAAPFAPRIETALADASALIDSYLRRRYLVPLAPVPREILRACCVLARFDLAQGGDKTPTEEMRRERDAVLAWLQNVGEAEGRLDAEEAGVASAARVQDRARLFAGGLP
jgi:phage gp36-like protein